MVEAEEPEPREPSECSRELSEGSRGAGKVEAIKNEVGNSTMAAADTESRPETWVSRIGLREE